MDRLPTDILYEIFIQLPFSQKQECMLVCHQWENIINTSCLFHTLSIDKKKNCWQFYKKFLDRLEQTSFVGTQVMNLYISVLFKDYDKIKLIRSLPNLRRVEIKMKTRSDTFCSEDFKMSTSKSRIEHIRENYECGLTRTLAKYKLCSCLVDLDLDLGFLNAKKIDVFPELKNMPALKQLVLRNCVLNMDQLEVLHDNIPSLKELMICESFFSDSDSIPANISPATSISNLTVMIRFIEAAEQDIDWLFYISQKYPHLEHFQYSRQDEFYDKDDAEIYRRMYRVGYIPLLKALGARLKSLDIRGAEFEEYTIMEKMDTFGCQIKKLVLNSEKKNAWLSVLSRSEQAKYIEDLTIYNIQPCQFEWIKEMKMLNSLVLTVDTHEYDDSDEDSDADDSYVLHNGIYVFVGESEENHPAGFFKNTLLLNKLLESCPKTVKTIRIDHLFIDAEAISETYPFLERLELCTYRLPNSFNSFISTHLPNLHHLVLERCVKNGESLNLPNHYFSYFEVFISGHIVLLTTLDREDPRLYDANSRSHTATPKHDCYIKPMSIDGFTGKIHASFTFGSVKKFNLNTYPLLLN